VKTIQDLGQVVAQLRKERGLTQVAVASQAGITKDLLSRFERGGAGGDGLAQAAGGAGRAGRGVGGDGIRPVGHAR
jgi:transcriptional regulator with XRE-family HTH domain